MQRLLEKINYVLLGSRTCVSVKNPNEIINEINEKYNSGEKVYSFISNVFLKGKNTYNWHLSPFGLIWQKGNIFRDKFKGQGMYSLRHIIENLIDKKVKSDKIKEILHSYLINVKPEQILPFEHFYIEQNLVYCINNGQIKHQEIYIQEEPDGLGFYIIWDGVSRVATHQLVRHQSFDFQQQSQRYIDYSKRQGQLTGFYIPPSIHEKPQEEYYYILFNKEAYNSYRILVDKQHIKPEDARFYLPCSFTSRIFMFVPKKRIYGRDGIKEFIEKRKYHSQEEIKNFALKLEEILRKYY
ncbi:MAG: FAD-dependent thymidylate synthase [Nanoarchaeota archaeon]